MSCRGRLPPPTAVMQMVQRNPYGSVANWCAAAQRAMYRILNSHTGNHGSNFPVPFHSAHPYNFADEFYRVIAEIGKCSSVAFSISRIDAIVDILHCLLSVRGLDNVNKHINQLRVRSTLDPFQVEARIVSKEELTHDQQEDEMVRLIVAHDETYKVGQTLRQPGIGALVRLLEATMWFSRKKIFRDLKNLISTLYPELYAKGKYYRSVYTKLTKWFYEGKCLALLLGSDEHTLPPGIIIMLSEDLSLRRNIGAAACRQLGISLSSWPGLQQLLSAVTQDILLPSLIPRSMEGIRKRLRAIKKGLILEQYSCITDGLERPQDEGSLPIKELFSQLCQHLKLFPGGTIAADSTRVCDGRIEEMWRTLQWPLQYDPGEADTIVVKSLSKVEVLDD